MSTEAPVVLVTGATGPLGRVVVRRFAADGARMALVGRNRARLEALAAKAGLGDDDWMPIVAELTDADAATAAVATVEARFGRVDVLLHLVGGWAGGTAVVDLDPEEVRTMLDQHLWTTFNVVRAVVPGMVERGFGRVLAVTSPFASNPAGKGASYAIAKAAEEVLLRSLARETANTGVTANLVVVRTIDMRHERKTEPTPKNASWTTPEEIADAFIYLASPAAAAVTGTRLALDGR
jgi:NAD(P)-dependent dehydrogenase (short-subunit alcohol dehydrogenase family)